MSAGPGATTSMWPLRISDRPPRPDPGAGSQSATTLALPARSQLNGDASGCSASASASSGCISRRQPERFERVAHDELAGQLVAEYRRPRDELDQELLGIGLARGDGGQDLAPAGGHVERHRGFLP